MKKLLQKFNPFTSAWVHKALVMYQVRIANRILWNTFNHVFFFIGFNNNSYEGNHTNNLSKIETTLADRNNLEQK